MRLHRCDKGIEFEWTIKTQQKKKKVTHGRNEVGLVTTSGGDPWASAFFSFKVLKKAVFMLVSDDLEFYVQLGACDFSHFVGMLRVL